MAKSGDMISRQAALSAFNTDLNDLIVDGRENAERVERYLNRVLDKIKSLPSLEEESFEWCTECGQGRTVAPYDFCSYAERRETE